MFLRERFSLLLQPFLRHHRFVCAVSAPTYSTSMHNRDLFITMHIVFNCADANNNHLGWLSNFTMCHAQPRVSLIGSWTWFVHG